MPQSSPRCPNCQYPLDAPFESDDGTVFVCVPRTDPTTDPRATLELLTILERFDDADLNNRTWCESFADEIGPSVPTIIRDLRRLVEYETALHAIQIGKMPADNKHPQGEYFSMAMRFHKIAKDALAHREGQ